MTTATGRASPGPTGPTSDDPLAAAEDEDIAIAAITASELLQAVLRAGARHRTEREAFVEGVLAALTLGWSLATLDRHRFERIPGLRLAG